MKAIEIFIASIVTDALLIANVIIVTLQLLLDLTIVGFVWFWGC